MSQAYTKVKREKEEAKQNEIYVAAQGALNKYFRYAAKILTRSDEYDSITIRASGQAIRKAISLVEVIKQNIGDLHQINTIHTMNVVDEWEPKYFGLEVLT